MLHRIVYGILLVLILVGCALEPKECVVSVEYRRDIKSISLQTPVKGTYFLIAATVNNRPTYSFYEVLESGARYRRDVPAETTLLFEDTAPGVAWVEKKTGRSMGNETCSILDEEIPSLYGLAYWYEIHIPEGSIAFEVDVNIK